MPRRPTSPPSERNSLRDRLTDLDGGDDGDPPPFAAAWRADVKTYYDEGEPTPAERRAQAYWFGADTTEGA